MYDVYSMKNYKQLFNYLVYFTCEFKKCRDYCCQISAYLQLICSVNSWNIVVANQMFKWVYNLKYLQSIG